MEVSYKFRNLEKNLIKLILPIANNENIKRYLCYLDEDPLDKNKPDITKNIINEYIYLMPFNEKTLNDSKVMIFYYPEYGDLRRKPTGTHRFLMDIICPYSAWIFQGKMRPIEIANEVSKLIDGKNIAGVGEVNITNYKSGKLDETYGFFTLFIEIESVTTKGKDI